jgi:hypothetical protein
MSEEPLLLTEASTESFLQLASEFPPPHVDRCVAVLDSLTMSTHSCTLRLEDGSALRADLAATIDLELVRALLGEEVLAEGNVHFRASGRVHRMEIDLLTRATPLDEVWKRPPRAEPRPGQLLPSIGEARPLFGQWPGDESDEQIFDALRELS